MHKAHPQNTIKASEFKAKCLKLMDEVSATGEELVITKNNQPVARLVPYQQKPETLFGIDRGKLDRQKRDFTRHTCHFMVADRVQTLGFNRT